MLELPTQSPRKARAPSHHGFLWMRTRVLCPAFLARVLVVRACFVCLSLASLDSACSIISSRSSRLHDGAGSWGWSSRLGLLGLLLPLLANVWGLAWPMLFLSSYESHYSAFHKAVIYISCLGKVLEEISPFSSSSSCQAAMLLQGVLFVVHQDAHYVELLAGMLLTYSLCRAAAFVWPGSKGGNGGTYSSSTPASDALSITLAGEFMVISFLGCVLLYRVYCKYIGPRHSAFSAIRSSSFGARTQPFSHTNSWRSHASSAPEHHDSCTSSQAPSAGGFAQDTGAPASAWGKGTLQQAYLWKMAAVKFCNGMFMLVFAWSQVAAAMSRQHTAGLTSSLASSRGSWWGQLAYCWSAACASGPVNAALLSALVPMMHSLLAAVHGNWFRRHIRLFNALSLYLCFFARVYLVGVHMVAGGLAGGGVPQAVEGAAATGDPAAGQANLLDSSSTAKEAALPPQFAFHSFVVLVTSLIVHEDPLPWFAAQLVGCAVLCRQGHLLLLSHTTGLPSMQAALQRFTSLEVSVQLPEYFIICGVALVLYRWLCVGMYGGRSRYQASPAGHMHRQGSSSRSSISMPSTLQASDKLLSPRRPPAVWVPAGSGDGSVGPDNGWEGAQAPSAEPSRSPFGETSRLGGRSLCRHSTGRVLPQLQQELLAELAPSAWPRPDMGIATAAAAAVAAAPLAAQWPLQALTAEDSSRSQRPAPDPGKGQPRTNPQQSQLGSSPASADGGRSSGAGGISHTPGSGSTSSSARAANALLTRLYAGWQLLLVSAGAPEAAPDSTPTTAAQAGTWSDDSYTDNKGAALLSHTATRNAIRVLLWLPAHAYMCLWFVCRALSPSSSLLPAARIMGGAGALLYGAAPLLHLGLVLLKPHLAVGGGDRLLPIQLVLSTCLFQATAVLLKVPEEHDARLLLLTVAAAFGLLCISAVSAAIWFPPLMAALYVAHAWEHHALATWTFRVASAATFLTFPPIAYAVGRLVSAAGDQAFAPLLAYLLPGCRKLCPLRGDRLAAGVSHSVILLANLALLSMLIHQMAGDPRIMWDGTKMLLISTLDRLDVSAAAQTSTLQTMGVVLGAGLCFAVVSGLHAIMLSRQAAGNLRLKWYEQQKAQVHTLGEQVISQLTACQAEDDEPDLEEALLQTLSAVAAACFPAATTSLILLEGASLECSMAERHLLHQGLGLSRQLPRHELVKVEEVPSVVQACRQEEPLFIASDSHNAGSCIVIEGYPDLEELANEYGMDAFLVVPLACAGQDQGALLVTSRAPVSLDKYSRLLASDLGHALSQTLYTLSCIGQMRAGEAILADIMPEQAAKQLKARVIKTHKTLSTLSPVSPGPASRKSFAQSRPPPMAADGSAAAIPAKLEEAASTLKAQQEKLLEARQQRAGRSLSNSRMQMSRRVLRISCDAVPVVYKQWHPAVSVLFADISSYTAMSQQVEPEQVMLLLHELFSKYDNLCTRYGIYKVETIGDCYMACSGLLVDNPDHARHLVEFGQAMLGVAASVPHPLGGSVHIRVGVHSGRVMSGIVGSIRARYCLFGDTVNTASRMESTGVVDHIQISEDTYQLLGELQSDFDLREAVAVKGKGVMNTYVLREDVAAALVQEGQQHMHS